MNNRITHLLMAAAMIFAGCSSEDKGGQAAPVLLGLTPNSGPGGQEIHITGSNLGETPGRIVLGAQDLQANSWSPTEVVAAIPTDTNAGTYSLQVTAAGLPSNRLSFSVLPNIVTLPESAKADSHIYLEGTGFSTAQGSVMIGGLDAKIADWSPTRIRVRTPQLLQPGPQAVVVTAASGLASVERSINLLPTITGISENRGTGGSALAITGFAFGDSQGASQVLIGGIAAEIPFWSNYALTVVVPDGARPGSTEVVIQGRSGTDSIPLTVYPSIGLVEPSDISKGDVITITGSNFGTEVGTVHLGSVMLTVTSWTQTAIEVFVNETPGLGEAELRVNAGGQDTLPFMVNIFPGITTISSASVIPGASITLIGSHFGISKGTGTVSIGGVSVTVTSWSNTNIVATIPTWFPAGTYEVAVSTDLGYWTAPYLLDIKPRISSLSSYSGTVLSGFTIAGAGFDSSKGTSVVTLGGVVVSTGSWSNTSIAASVPTGVPAGVHDVVVQVEGLESNAMMYTVRPSVNLVTPAQGAVGATVTISGASFGNTQGAGAVKIGGVSAQVVSWSNTAISAIIPDGMAAGNQNITVTVASQESNTILIQVRPGLSGLSPASATAGTSLTLTGTSFGHVQGSSTVTVGDISAPVISWTDTRIVFTPPLSIAAGSQLVRVNVGGLSSFQRSLLIQPTVTALSAYRGPVGGNLTISGNNLGTSQGSSTVTIGGLTASVVSWNPLVVAIPSGLGSGSHDVAVTVGGQTSEPLHYLVTPGISGVNPPTGPSGAEITVEGSNFGAYQAESAVTVGGINATVLNWSNTTIALAIPTGLTAGTHNIVVTVNTHNSNAYPFGVIPAIEPPSPLSGSGGTVVTITGTNLGNSQGASTVTIGGVAAPVVSWSNTSIVVTVPTNVIAGNHNLVVTVNGQAAAARSFTVLPAISQINPASSRTGLSLTITGTNFGSTKGASGVSVGGLVASVSAWSMTAVNITIPSGLTAGSHDVLVTVGAQTSSPLPLTVTPGITGTTPTSATGNATITIAGTSFGPSKNASTISLGGTELSVTSWSSTAIQAVAPAAVTAGTRSIMITVNGLVSNAYAFALMPSITSLSTASATAGAQVTLFGRNFGNTKNLSTVTLGGTALPVASWSMSAIAVTVPSNVGSGMQNFLVTVEGRTSNSYQLAIRPTITSISNASGTGGGNITISGVNFGDTIGSSSVTVGGVSSPVVSWSMSSIVATIPVEAPAGQPEVVVTVGGQGSNLYPITVSPSLTSLSPANSPAGSSVVLNGTNLGGTQGASTISFGGIAPTITAWTNTAITVTVPPTLAVGLHDVFADVEGLQSNSLVHAVISSVSSVSPISGSGGSTVTISGSNFGTTQGSSTVTFGGEAAAVSYWSNTTILVTVPDGVPGGDQEVRVIINEAASNVAFFTVVPVISGLDSVNVTGGDSLVITGTNFGASQGTGAVSIGGVGAMVVSWSPLAVTVTVSETLAAGNQTIVVTAGGQSSNAFNLIVHPTITSLSLTGGTGGDSLTVSGTNFGAIQGASTLRIGSVDAAVTSWSTTSLVVSIPDSVPAGTPGVVAMVGGYASNELSLAVNPAITLLAPVSGTGGDTVVISGTNFDATQSTSWVSIGGVVPTISAWGHTSIAFAVPPTVTSGIQNVIVAVGGHASNAVPFTVKPHLSSVNPRLASGHQTINITATNMGPAKAASGLLLGATQLSVTGWSQTAITAEVPGTFPVGVYSLVSIVEGQVSNTLPFTQVPGIESISPDSGAAGTQVTITGRKFGASQGTNMVTVGGYTASVVSWSDVAIVVVVPELTSKDAAVKAVVSGLSSNEVPFHFSMPYITERFPAVGTAGTQVWLLGMSLGEVTGSVTVAGENAGIAGWTDAAVQITIPTNVSKGRQPIVLHDAGGQAANTVAFTQRGSDVWYVEDTLAPRTYHIAAWTGTEMIIWGGANNGYMNTGSRYFPSTDSWLAVSTVGAPSARNGAANVWTGKELVVWGGGQKPSLTNTGGRYNPASDTWVATNTADSPGGVFGAQAVWTGSEVLFWGGEICTSTGGGYTCSSVDTGARYIPDSDTWVLMNNSGAPSARTSHTAVWTGREMIVWGGYGPPYPNIRGDGGRYSPETNSWTSIASGPSARYGHSAVWAGIEMIIWGGHDQSGYFNSGSRYQPQTNTWVDITRVNAPQARYSHRAVWAGSNMLIWGGSTAVQAVSSYSPDADAWTTFDAPNAPESRTEHSLIWTGEEMIVWGGRSTNGNQILNSGGRFNPQTGTWAATSINSGPVITSDHIAVWSGSQFLLWGGNTKPITSGARYVPATDTWLPMSQSGAPEWREYFTSLWMNDSLLIWGGYSATNTYLASGGRYSPATDSWATTGFNGAPTGRAYASAIWTGTQAIIWGGKNLEWFRDGARYNPGGDTWTTMALNNAPAPRISHTAIWTGSKMVVWGGFYSNYSLDTGGIYTPGTNTWVATAAGAPSQRYRHTAVWANDRMIVWGGKDNSAYNSGSRFDPIANVWEPTTTSGAPAARYGHSTAWTGKRMLIWGGGPHTSSSYNDGALYDPVSNTWTPTTMDNVPEARFGFPYAWSGNELIIYGGPGRNGLAFYIP